MKEIKFRAWDGKKFAEVKMLEWVSAEDSFTGKQGWNVNQNLGTPLEFVQQFTGLKDKNGKEIYEGDILAPMPNDYKDQYKGNWQVVFHDGAYFGEDSDGHHITWLPYWTEEQFEVIGNIYENKETLND